MLGSQHQEIFEQLAESKKHYFLEESLIIIFISDIKKFQEDWKSDYLIESNFKTGSLKIMVVQENLTKHRLK